MVKSKAKGSGFEREISKFLTDWCGGDSKKCDWVWRCPSSGGKATILTSNTTMTGDLIPIHPDATFFFNIFSIECKTGYGNNNMEQLLKNVKNKTILSFWEQCLRDADKANRFPLLIYKNGPIKWVATSQKFLNYYGNNLKNLENIVYLNNDIEIIFYNFDNFFKTINIDVLKQLEKGKKC